MVLSKRVTDPGEISKWIRSSAYADIFNFVELVNVSVKGRKITDSPPSSENIRKVIVLLKCMYSQVDQIPLLENPQRYGNKAFQDYYTWLCESAQTLIHDMFASESEHIDELATYLTESVGNPVRIDYGTGHELSFIAFLVCLFKLNFLKNPDMSDIRRPGSKSTELNDFAAVALHVLPVYLQLVRHLQRYFRMEPAGSHGSWSLDDFQFIPYLWGSSQLMGSGLEPWQIPDSEIASKEASSFLFFSCIDYINEVKSGPFSEHSSCLQSLCEVPHWQKVNSGMIKMYKGEVLGKFPIIQHFLFGKLLKYEPASVAEGFSEMPGLLHSRMGPPHPKCNNSH